MKRLGWLVFPLLVTACAQKPPTQVVEPLPPIPETPGGTARPLSDMPGTDGKPIEEPVGAPPEAFQPVKGTLDGKPFELKGAGTTALVDDDGRVTIVLANYRVDCALHTAGPDDKAITIRIPWKPRVRVELGSLPAKEITATFFDEKKKRAVPIRGFKPKGTLDVLAAPDRPNSSGRIKLELTSGADAISAEIPVRFCHAK